MRACIRRWWGRRQARFDRSGEPPWEHIAGPEPVYVLDRPRPRRSYRHVGGCACGATTTATSRDPAAYAKTWCTRCSCHLPVGEFVWSDDGAVLGS